MQAMARAQAEGGGAPGSPGKAPQQQGYPFEVLRIWRSKMQDDLRAADAKGPGQRYRLRLLVQQGKDVEQAVLGCLKDALFELHEGVVWGLLDPAFEEQQRQQLLNAAANELHNDKQLVLEMAREAGLLSAYAAEVQKPANSTLADYERAGELKFALLVWRANLRRDASLLAGDAAGVAAGAAGGGGDGDALALEARLHSAYSEALRLIRRCGQSGLAFWSSKQAGGAPTADSKRRLYSAALQRVQNALIELAAAHPGVDAGGLRRLFEQLSDPEAVEAEGEEADEEAEGSEGGEGGASGDEAGAAGIDAGLLEPGRGSSEESETTALGL